LISLSFTFITKTKIYISAMLYILKNVQKLFYAYFDICNVYNKNNIQKIIYKSAVAIMYISIIIHHKTNIPKTI